jgi:hypothetical protein
MAMRTDHDPADWLNRYLDARTADQSADLRLVEPALAQTVEAFFAADDTPGPPPGLAQRIWADVLSQTDTPRPMALPVREPAASNGHGRRGWQPAAPERGPSALAFLATAALLLLSLGLGAVVVRTGAPRAPTATEAAGPATGEPSSDVTLLDVTLADLPRSHVAIGTAIGILPAGSRLALTLGQHGPEVIFVAAGPVQLQVSAGPQPVRVIPPRAGRAQPDTHISTGQQSLLATGATIVVPPGGAVALSPAAGASAKILELLMPADARELESNGATWQQTTNGGVTQTVSGLLSLGLRQTTLAPGGTLPAPGGASQQVVLVPDATQMGDVRSLATGAVRNASQRTVSLYVITVAPGSAGTPRPGTPSG